MANVFDQFDSPTAPAPVAGNPFDQFDPPSPRPRPAPQPGLRQTTNPFDQFDPPQAEAALPPQGGEVPGGSMQPPPPAEYGKGFWNSFWNAAAREKASPSAASSLDLIGLKLGTMDPAKFALEQATMQQNLAKLPPVDPKANEWSLEYLGTLLGAIPSQIAEGAVYGIGGATVGAGVGAAGGPLGAGGGALVGFGAGAGLQDMSRTFIDRLSQAGVDVKDPAALQAALSDPDTFEPAFWYAARRAGAVGLLTALTGKGGNVVAEGAFRPVLGGAGRRTLLQKTGVGAVGAGAGAVGGAIQETGGQLAGGGRIEDPGAILDEAIAGIVTEAPAIAAPSVVEGAKWTAAPFRKPEASRTVPPLGAKFDPQTGQVTLTDNVFDLDMNDPEVAAAASFGRDLIEHAQARNDDIDSLQHWRWALDLEGQQHTQIGRMLSKWFVKVEESVGAETPYRLDSMLQLISKPLARTVPVDPNAPMPESMVAPIKGVQPGGKDFQVDLAEGRTLSGRQTLIVRGASTELTPEAVAAIVDRAEADGYEAVAFEGNSPLGSQLIAAIGDKAEPAAVDVLFGGSEDLAVVPLRQGDTSTARPVVSEARDPNTAPSGWGAIEADPVSRVRQSLTAKMSPEEISTTLRQMERTAQRIIKGLRISKSIVFHEESQGTGASWRGQLWGRGKDGQGNQYDLDINPSTFTTVEDMWSTIMHEVGHAVMFDRLNRADSKTQLAILSDYATWRAGLMNEIKLQRQHRQINVSRATTTNILTQFEATRGRLKGFPNDPAYLDYWSSYGEWFAQQVARWATTQERPLTVVDQFFSSLGKQLRRLLERLYRATGLRFEPSRAVQTYLDAFLEDMTPEVFGSVYDRIERQTRAANLRALKASGAEYVEAFPQHPATGPSREILRRLFSKVENETYVRGVKKSLQELEGLAAHADRISTIYEHGVGLYQLAENNKHIRGLQLYKETLSLAEIFKSKFLDRGIKTAKRMAKISNLEAFHQTADDYGQMRYLSDDEVKQGVVRLPTDAELVAIFDQHGLDAQARSVFGEMVADYQWTLGELEAIRKLEIEKRMRKAGGAVDLAAAAKALEELDAEMTALRKKPYVPQMRFGDYAVTVWAKGKDGSRQRVWFSTNESEKAQRATARELKALYSEPAFEVVTSMIAKDTIPMMGLPRPLLEMVAARVELSPTQKEFLRDLAYEQAPPQSYRHRFQRRSNLQGYSKDFTRAYASYFLHAGNWFAKARFGDELRSYVKGVQEESRIMPDEEGGPSRGNLRARIGNYMADHMKNWMDPKPDFWRLKAASFFIALGYNPISAFVNLTSVITSSYPVLGAGFGDAAAMSALGRASTSFARKFKTGKDDYATAARDRMRAELVKESVLDEGFAADLAGIAEGRNLLTRFPGWDQRFAKRQLDKGAQAFSWMSEKASWMFRATEKGVRYVTADAAFDLAMKYPQADYVKEAIEGHHEQFQRLIREGWNPIEAAATVTARRAVQTSQGVYTRWARPRFMRGKGGTLFQFKAFLQNMLWMMWSNKDAATRTLLAFGLLGGMMAQPGMEDISDILKVLANRLFGKDFDLEREARQMVVEFADIDPDWIMHGTASHGFGLPGLTSIAGETLGLEWMQQLPNVDLSGRVSAGQLSPVPPRIFMPTDDINSAIAEGAERASGAAFGLGFTMFKVLTDVRNTDAWMRLVPAAFRNMPKAYEALQTGRIENPNGAAVLTFDVRDPEQMLEVLAFGMGVNPLRLAQEWRADREVREVTQFWYMRQQILLRQLAEAVRAREPEEMAQVMEAIRNYNETIPKGFESQRITPDSARRSVEQRERRRLHSELNIPIRRQDRPIAGPIRDLYVQDPTVQDVRKVPAAK